MCSYWGHRNAALTKCVLPCPRMSIVRGNYVRMTSVKKQNKIVQEITRNVANVFSFYPIIAIGLSFQHLPRDLANVNAWKTMFDPYIGTFLELLYYTETKPQGYKTFFHAQLSWAWKFSLLINMKMPKIVGIFIFIIREIFMLSYV